MSGKLQGTDFEGHFRAVVGRKNEKGHPISVCMVPVEKDGTKKPCGEEVPRPNYSKSYYLSHMEVKAKVCNAHKQVLEKVNSDKEKQQQVLAHAFRPATQANEQKDKLARLFANRGWSHATVDDPDFRDAFGNKVPDGFNRKGLRERILELAKDTKHKLFEMNAGRDVFLMADGGTINRKRHVNISFAVSGGTYFLKSVRMDRVDAAALKTLFIDTIDELRAANLFVFAIVCDNASAYRELGFESSKVMTDFPTNDFLMKDKTH